MKTVSNKIITENILLPECDYYDEVIRALFPDENLNTHKKKF